MSGSGSTSMPKRKSKPPQARGLAFEEHVDSPPPPPDRAGAPKTASVVSPPAVQPTGVAGPARLRPRAPAPTCRQTPPMGKRVAAGGFAAAFPRPGPWPEGRASARRRDRPRRAAPQAQRNQGKVACGTATGRLSAIISCDSDTVPQLASQGERRAHGRRRSAAVTTSDSRVAPCSAGPVRRRLQEVAGRRPADASCGRHLQRVQHRVGAVARRRRRPRLAGRRSRARSAALRPRDPVHHGDAGGADAALGPDRAGDLQRWPMRKGGHDGAGRRPSVGDRGGIGDDRIDDALAARVKGGVQCGVARRGSGTAAGPSRIAARRCRRRQRALAGWPPRRACRPRPRRAA